jgi:hypothetical protein
VVSHDMTQPIEKKTGRPKGEEPTVAIALRIPTSMCEQLDQYVEHLETETGLKASRTEVCRHALRLYLKEQSILSKPKASRQRTQKASRS